MSASDNAFMARALQLAERGRYTTQPNPRVGCVIVSKGDNVGEGWHQRAGEPHAEVRALNAAGEQARGATVYVTLEPCSHFGRTPPCADALVKAGVARVVAAMQDPNPAVAGSGLQKLKDAGIAVDCGVMQVQAELLNAGFIKRMQAGLPRVVSKQAMSLDGRTAMASGESQWITGADARRDVQRLRAESGAIISGVDSIMQDDSALTVRAAELGLPDAALIAQRQPLRVVIDSRLRLAPSARLLREPGRTVVATLKSQGHEALIAAGAEILLLPARNGHVDLKALLQHLARKEQVNDVLLESGATLNGAFLQAQLIDECRIYIASVLLGSTARPLFELPLDSMAQKQALTIKHWRAIGNDFRVDAVPVYKAATNE
jgi:diaminohydroxyphosphoribosylaminopyrimidine deaminase/5-amino-6-(5-phosphoribosylamino)uracil reductase